MRWCTVLFLLICCTSKPESPVVITWEDKKAIAVSFEAADSLIISVEGSSYGVLGEITSDGGRTVFTPAIPFERGQSYRTSSGLAFTIPSDSTRKPPVLLGSFPSCDTVPSNLLKIYLRFSEPMSEGRSAQFLQLFDAVTGDTIRNAFLDLQPELWNEDGTVLTLWLDPGRIKQDLIPNKKLGVVMDDNRKYRLAVAKGWRSKNGLSLQKGYSRSFVTKERDVTKPDPSRWTIKAGSDTVEVQFNESLDWSLLHSTLSIADHDSKTISEVCEKHLIIVTGSRLKPGDYSLNIESRLEDLAGNNLNRLFETDITNKSDTAHPKEVYTLPFHVK